MAYIVVCGYAIRHPVAGNMLAFFHYLLGFSKLGHQVVYLEESGWPQSCYDPASQTYSDNPLAGIQSFKDLLSRFGVNAKVSFINRETGKTYGLAWDDIKQVLTTADVLLNIGGVCWLPEFKLCQQRALIDMDPFFTQVGKFATEGLEDYQTLFSYGVNIGKPGCSVPTNGRDWLPTVPPIVPEIWTFKTIMDTDYFVHADADIPFTTIANWNAYGSITYQDKTYGQKREEFLRLLNLPKRVAFPLELALSGISCQEHEQLESAGWRIRDSHFTEDFDQYQAYITQSKGEFSVAKQAYVETRSGWFSDRSVCYLAAGHPVVLQDTGFSEWLPTGWGVLAFSSLDEAVDCLARVHADYDKHSLAAQNVAEQTFSYQVVLPHLLRHSLDAPISSYTPSPTEYDL
jgi:hypothetical protein